MPKKVCFGVARRTHTPLHQKCDQGCLWVPSMSVFETHNAKYCAFFVWRAERIYVCHIRVGVFEMHNAKKYVLLVWRAERTHLCTKSVFKGVFGYLVWVCLKRTMPHNVCFRVVYRTQTLLHQKFDQELDT